MAAQNSIVITYRMKGDKGSMKAVIKDVDGLKAALNGTMMQGSELKKVFSSLTGQTTQFNGVAKGLEGALTSGFGAIGKYAAGFGTVSTALFAAKKAINSVQFATDEYGRIMNSASSVTQHFFQSIMTGSFDSFLKGLKDVIKNARDAYDALDNLGTFNIYNTKVTAEFSERRSKIKSEIRQGINVEANKKALKELEKEEEAYYKKQGQLSKDAANQKLIDFTGSKKGSGWLQPYIKDYNGQKNAARDAKKLYDEYFDEKGYARSQAKGINWYGLNLDKKYAALIKYSELDDEKSKEVMSLYAQSSNAMTQMYNMRASDARLMNTKTGGNSGGKSGGKSSSSSYIDAPVDLIKFDQSQGDLANLIKKYNQQLLETTNQVEYDQTNAKIQELQELLDYMQDNKFASVTAAKMSKNIADSMKEDIAKGIEETVANLPPMEIPVVLGKPDADSMMQATKTAAQGVASALSSASTAMGQFGQKSEEAAQASAIMSIAASIAQLVAQFAAIPKGAEIWSWIAGTVAGTGALISSIAQIKSATAFANGGIVSGPTHALVGEYAGAKQNPEVIAPLNRLKDLLGSDDMSGMGGEVVFRIGDRELIGVLNRRSNYISRG